MSNEPTRVDGFIRTSHRKEDGRSPEQQKRMAQSTADYNGYEIVYWHDAGKSESGMTMARPAMDLYRKRVKEGKTKGAIFAFTDRYGRAAIEEAMAVAREFCRIGILVFTDGGGHPVDLSNPQEETNLVLQFQLARQQVMQIRKRFIQCQRDAVNRGHWVGTVPPGYLHPEMRSPLVLDSKVAPLITEMFKKRLTGATSGQLWQYLQDNWPQEYLDDPPRKKADPPHPGSPQPPAHPGSILGLLKCRAYVGDIVRGMCEEPGNEQETQAIKRNAHPAIVDRATFKRVQDMRVPRGRNGKSNRLLARLGVLVCDNCGSKMCVSPAKNGYYPAYKCAPNPKCPGYNTIGADHAERVVWEWVLAHDGKGKGNKAETARKAAQQAAKDQQAYDDFVADYDPSEPADRVRKAELKAIKDASQELSDRFGDGSTLLRRKVRDLNDLERDEKRQLILDNVKFARVHPFESHGKKRVEIVGISESLGDFV